MPTSKKPSDNSHPLEDMLERTILPPEVTDAPPTDPLPAGYEQIIGRIIDGNLPEEAEIRPTSKQ